MAVINKSVVSVVNTLTNLGRALCERVVPEGYIVVGEKPSAPIPLIAMECYKVMDGEERRAYCEMLVKTQFEKKRSFTRLDDVEEHFAPIIEQQWPYERTGTYSPKQVKKRAIIPECGPFKALGHTNTWYVDYMVWRHRLPEQRLVLRNIILRKRQVADVWARLKKHSPIYTVADAEMESVAGPAEQAVSTSNVVLGETQIESIDLADTNKPASWYNLSSTEENPNYSNLTDRFTLYRAYEWKVDEPLALTGTLPKDFVNHVQRANMPMFIPFHIHQYWRGDMEIKIHINSNKFQAGQLIVSWLYGGHWESFNRSHVAEMVQMPHVLINAGASNEATLIIPYRYHVPYMNTKRRDEFPDSLCMGNIYLNDLVPLTTSQNGPRSCHFSMFIRFTNSSFTGLVDGSIASPEMDTLKTVVGLANGILNMPNCDNPPSNEPPTFVVPTVAHSWCIGNGLVEPIHRLSLSANIGTRHTADMTATVTTHDTIIRKFGLLRRVKWDSNDTATNVPGALIWSCNVHPQVDKNLLFTDTEDASALFKYYIPPCGVIASLYEYWRGSLEFKFDIVATSFHTGRLLIAYIPGVRANKKITLEQARNSAHIVFSLQDSSSFTFVVPYISDRPWWKRKYGGPQRRSECASPSALFMFVLNPLVPMESVVKYITIVPYVRAGIDMEFAVPAQPAIGISWNAKTTNPDIPNNVQFKEGYYPVYTGAWHNFFESKKLIFRYGSVSDHIAQLDKISIPSRPKRVIVWSPNVVYSVRYMINGTLMTGQVVAGVAWSLDGYFYMIPCLSTQSAVALATFIKIGNINDGAVHCIDWYEEGPYTEGNIIWAGTEHDTIPVYLNLDNMAFPEMEREDTPNLMQPTRLLPSTTGGMLTFGENFNDLKDLCRRYQLYYTGSITLVERIRDVAFLQVPVVPSGLDLNVSSIYPMWSAARDGHIPIVLSGFRYFRGGIRLRIVINNYLGGVWVQHRPDRPLDHRASVKMGNKIAIADKYRNHSYGFYLQNLSINNVIEVEIPFYQPGVYGINGKLGDVWQATDLANFTSLGDIVIGLEGAKGTPTIDVSIYYSVADDFSMDVYTGFPAMVYSDDTGFSDVRALPEMNFVNSFTSGIAGSLLSKAVTAPVASSFRTMKKDLVAEMVTEAKSAVAPALLELENSVKEGVGSLTDALKGNALKQALTSSIGQLMQIIANPSPTSLAIAVCTMIGSLVSASLDIMVSLQQTCLNLVKHLWSKFFVRSNDPQADARTASHESETYSDETKRLNASFFSLVCGLVVTSLGMTCRLPKDYMSFTKGMKEDLGLANNAALFFKNSAEALVYCYEWCAGESSDLAKAKKMANANYPDMKIWVDEVVDLLDPRRRRLLGKSSKEANRVFDACYYGSLLIRSNMDKNCPGGKVIYDLYVKICKVRDDIVQAGNHPNVRFEPFPIYMVGMAGVGKSFLTAEICKELLQHIDYQSSEEMIYWLQLGQKYWSGIGNPPVVARDEAYAIDGTFTDEEIQTHMAMCSVSVFNPPMAAVEEKNKRINPLIYYMNSNVAFPKFVNARCPKAIYRRRKALIRAQFTAEILTKYPNIIDASQIDLEDRRNCAHLEFYFARNASDVNTVYDGPLTYEAMIVILRDRFRAHYERERVNFKRRMNSNYCLDPEYDPEDDMEFVQQAARCRETLKERFDRDRQAAQDFIDEGELQDEAACSYMTRMWTAAKDRFRAVFPESDDPQPSTSFAEPFSSPELNAAQRGFYTRDVSDQIATLVTRLHLDKGAVAKLVGNIDLETLTEEDIAPFCIMEDFLPIAAEPRHQYSHWIGTDRQSMWGFFLPCGGQFYGDSQIAHNDSAVMGEWSKRAISHWRNFTGMPALRSYVFWLMRQAQWLDITSKYDLEAEAQRVSASWPSAGTVTLDEIESSTTFTADEPNRNRLIRAHVLFCHLRKKGVCKAVCNHAKVWCENFVDLKRLKYNKRFNKFVYENSIGLEFTLSGECNCDSHFNSLFKNKLFKRALDVLWRHDHSLTAEMDSPFRMSEHEQLQVEARSFISRLGSWIKDWWQCAGKPIINTIITFLHDHIIKILVLLLGAWMVYKGFQAETRVAEYGYKFVGSFLAGDALNSAFREGGPNYFKESAVPRRGASQPTPASREFVETDVHVEKKVLNNACFLKCSWVQGEERREIKGRCLGIRQHQLLVIRHYIEEFSRHKDDGNFSLVLNRNGKTSIIELDWDNFSTVRYLMVNGKEGSSNLGVMTLPKYVPMFSNIVSYLPSAGMHKNVRSEADFISLDGPSRRSVRIDSHEFLMIAGDTDISAINLDCVYKYSHHGAGLCGSILLAPNVCNGNSGIIGMHVAGRNGIGYSEPLCREWFETCLPKDSVEYKMPSYGDLDDAQVELDGNMLFYGCVPDKFAHRESGKSQIIPSLLHQQVYDVKTEINPLRPGDSRQPPGSHPLRDGCNKHGSGRPGKFREDLLRMVSEDSVRVLFNKCRPTMSEVRELTLQEAICGSSHIPNIEPLNWNSSEGFPLSVFRPKGSKGKRWLFDLKESADRLELLGIDRLLEKMLVSREIGRLRGEVTLPLYVDCLKDYRLSPEKCKKPGSTRIFSIAPVQTTIDVRRYMGSFLSAYKSATIYAEHGIGINADSLQWTDLVHYLTERGANIVTGDYSNFGPSLSSQIVESCLEDILEWHRLNKAPDEVILHLRRLLFDEILMPIHLCANLVYQPLNGIGSGSPITAELNSEVNKKYVKYAWLKIMEQHKPEWKSMSAFADHCRLVTYGDDFIIGVSDSAIELFNCVTISECLHDYGITLTSADKGSTVKAYDKLSNSTFLKRSFKQHPTRAGLWLAPIAVQSVTECLNWCHKNNDIRFATEEVVRASLDLAYGHGPNFYKDHMDKICMAIKIHDLNIDFKSWLTRDEEVFGSR